MDRPRRSDCTTGQTDGEAGWWTTSGNIGLPPLARVMGVGRQQSKSLYEVYKKQYANDLFDNGTIETGNALMNNMKEEKKKRWQEVSTSTNMSHNSRISFQRPTSHIAPCLVSANQVAYQLLINTRGTMSSKPKRPVLSPTAEKSMDYLFSEEGYRRGIATLKKTCWNR